MIMDSRSEFADATSVVGAAGTALIGNQYNIQNLRDMGSGEPAYLVITVDTEIVTAAGAGTIKFQFVSDNTAAIATNGTATIHYDTGDIATNIAASNSPRLNAGSIICCVPLPAEGAVYEQFLGILAIIGTTAVSAGKINAFITHDSVVWKTYTQGAI